MIFVESINVSVSHGRLLFIFVLESEWLPLMPRSTSGTVKNKPASNATAPFIILRSSLTAIGV